MNALGALGWFGGTLFVPDGFAASGFNGGLPACLSSNRQRHLERATCVVVIFIHVRSCEDGAAG